ncbi:MAG: tRNA (adenosine(37)-N6)-threonylcarbamoyltransferase complex ATPase subunit type 1 TsaE [Acidimicrobiales bacterium]
MSVLVETRTAGAAQTQQLAAALAAALAPGDTVLLVGDLGAGKTTFAQGMAAGFGVVDPVTSPTFTLVRPYDVVSSPNGVRTMLHADLYRLDRLQEVVELSLGDLVEDGAVAVVEWGDVAVPALGPDAISVRLEPGAVDDERIVVVEFPSSRRDAAEALRARLAASAAS